MVRAATILRRLLCLGMAFALLAPAAASSAHNLRHDPALAAMTAHHPDQMSPAASLDRAAQLPAPDKQDGGHDHQLSLSVPVAILFGETPLVHPPVAAQAPPEIRVARLALRAAEPPPADPPRAS
jgi:hypothetical protein